MRILIIHKQKRDKLLKDRSYKYFSIETKPAAAVLHLNIKINMTRLVIIIHMSVSNLKMILSAHGSVLEGSEVLPNLA